MITREKLTYNDALYVFRHADPVVLAEWNSVVEFPTVRQRVKDVMLYSKFKWCLKMEGRPVAIFGAYSVTKTTLMGWCLPVQNASKKVWAQMLKEVKDAIRFSFNTGVLKRMHMIVCTDRPEPEFFATKLGMLRIGNLPYYGDGKDFMLMGVTYREAEE